VSTTMHPSAFDVSSAVAVSSSGVITGRPPRAR
jgi:hypothetical protein